MWLSFVTKCNTSFTDGWNELIPFTTEILPSSNKNIIMCLRWIFPRSKEYFSSLSWKTLVFKLSPEIRHATCTSLNYPCNGWHLVVWRMNSIFFLCWRSNWISIKNSTSSAYRICFGHNEIIIRHFARFSVIFWTFSLIKEKNWNK